MTKVQRNYKSTLFAMIYRDKGKLLQLYNAVNGTHYTNEDDLEITTLENAIYMNMKNDVSFILDFQLNLYEHQSTVNPNMPLRDLFYVSRVLQNLVKDCNLYGATLVKIPTPRFVVFYNGVDEQPARRVYCLSDAFVKQTDEPELELKVTVININSGNNEELLSECRDLWEYSRFIEKVRKLSGNMPIEQAVESAVDECIREGILAEFLSQNRAEAIAVSIFEYNEELHYAGLRQEGYERGMADGKAEGKAEAIIAFLEDCGEIPASLKESITSQTDLEILNKWIKLAAKVYSIEDFIERSGCLL